MVREGAVRCVPEDEDAGAEAERDGERGAEDAVLLAGLDLEPLGLGHLEPRRRLELRRRRLEGGGGGGGGGGVRLGPDDGERSGPAGGARGGGGTRGGGAAGQEEGRAVVQRGGGGGRCHGLDSTATATPGSTAWGGSGGFCGAYAARRGDEAIGVPAAASGFCQWSGWARSPTVHKVAIG